MIQLILFTLTFATTTIAGAEWGTGIADPKSLVSYTVGLPYSLSILFVLGCHEFGHYFAAKAHKVDATLPYFIPFPSFFGTMGAVIRTKSAILHNKALFDIGIYGPICGFVASVALLIYGFTHLPGIEYLLTIHPDYFSHRQTSGIPLVFGDNILLQLLRAVFTDSGQFLPPLSEIYHYPYLCVGWFGLFITAMNMIPAGQLDGGHITYSMFGPRNHLKIGRIAILVLVALGGIGAVDFASVLLFGKSLGFGWPGWLVWASIIYFVIKPQHPPTVIFQELDLPRKTLGYLAFVILFLTFSPSPFVTLAN